MSKIADIDVELVNFLIEKLAKTGRMTSSEILDEVPFGKTAVFGALTMLSSIGFLFREKAPGGAMYVYAISPDIGAYHITKAAEFGVDLAALSEILPITEKQKQAALALSAHVQKLKDLDASAKQERVRAIASSQGEDFAINDAITETLEKMIEASKVSVEEILDSGTHCKEVVGSLIDARRQAEAALKNYREVKRKGSSGADDYPLDD